MSKKSNSSRLKSAGKLIQDESTVISENPYAEKLQSSGSGRFKNDEKSKTVSVEDQVISNSEEIKDDLSSDIFTPDLPGIIAAQSEPIAMNSVVAKKDNQSGSSGSADSTSNDSPPHESSHNDSSHNGSNGNGSNGNGSNSNGSNNSGSSHDDSNHDNSGHDDSNHDDSNHDDSNHDDSNHDDSNHDDSNHDDGNDGCETEEPEICIDQPVCEDSPDESCSLAVLTGISVSLDESSAVQNAATSIVVGDSDDNDISVSKLPAAFASRLTALDVGTPLESALSGYDGTAGKNVFNLPSGGLVARMSLTNASGALLVGEDSGLKTLSGEAIYLFNDEINTDIVLGKTESGEIVFAVYLEQTSLPVQGGALWTVLYEPLFHNDSTNHDDQLSLDGLVFVKLDSLGSELLDTATPGQHLFFMVGDADAGYVVTGRDPANQSEGINPNKGDRVNVSNGGGSGSIGVNNQMIDPPAKSGSSQNNSGEGVVFTFVTNPNSSFTGENLSQTEADVEANIRFGELSNVETATFTVSQTQPVKAATVKISAYTTSVETGADFIDGLLDDDVLVDVIGVKVLNSLGVVLANSDGSVVNPLVQISFNDGSAIVKGVKADYQIEYETSGTHNRVLIENPGSSDKNFNSAFDIGSFSYEQPCTEIISIGEFIVFEDSGPSTGFNPVAYLDDDALSGGNAGGISDASPNQQNTSGVLAHQFGTDGSGSIAWLTSGSPSGFDYVLSDGNSLLIKQGTTTVLTLTLNASTGAYVVTQNAAVDHAPGMNENDQVFVVGYRVSDGDGDEAEGNLLLMVDDDTPVMIQNTIVHLDDDALVNGNPGGVGDVNPDVLNATGSLGISFGADGPGSVSWFTTGAPAGFTYELSDDDLLVKQDGVTVMTVSFDLEDSSYSVTQNAPVMHASGMDENDQNFLISFAVTDADDDTVRGTLSIRVDDDTPVVECLPIVKLDDDALPGGNPGGIGDDSPDVLNATGMLVSSFGADGPGSIEWISSGAPAGFTYQVSGDTLLIKQGDVTVITVSMNPISGAYTVVQNAPVMHPPVMNENDLALHVSYSVTDADQDCVIGSMLICIDDDTPVVSCSPIVHLDDDALPGGNPGGIGDADPDFSNASGVISVSFGADGSGSLDWIASGAPVGFTYEVSGDTLSIKQGSTTVITALLDPETGAYSVVQNAPVMHAPGMNENDQTFLLSYRAVDADGDSVIGSIFVVVDDDTPVVACLVTAQLDDDALPGGNPGGIGDVSPDTINTSGTLVFSVGADGLGSINWLTTGAPTGFTYEASGDDLLVKQGAVTVITLTLDTETGAYTITQNAPVMHAEGLDENDQNFSFAYLVTDADGDSATGELMVSVDDDTPVVVQNAIVQLDDDALAGGNPGGIGDVSPDTANTSGTLGYSFGADGVGSFAWETTGAPAGFTYEASGDDLLVKQGAVTVMTLALDTETGAYTVTQNAPIMHAEGLDENDQDFSFAYLVTDADGDSATGELMVSVDDDTPVVLQNAIVQLDDDALVGGNPGGIGDVNPDTANTSGTLGYSFGADGAGSFAWETTGAPAGFTYEASGDDLLVKQGAVTVMTLALDTETDAYTVTQNAPIMHAEGLDENDQNFVIAYQVSDADGDTVSGQLQISVDDDTPVVVENAIVLLDDDALAGGNPGGIADVAPDTQNTSGTLGYAYGADGEGSLNWLTTGAPAGFTYEASGDDLLVKQGTVTVMTLTLNTETGAYTVTQNAPVTHPTGLDENNESLIVIYGVSDADGDVAVGQLVIVVDDDTPVVTENALVILDDEILPGGVQGGVGDISPDSQNTSGTISHSFGADGSGSITWLSTGAPVGFTYEVSDNNLYIKQGSVTVVTATIDPITGSYSTIQNSNILHPIGSAENDQLFDLAYTVVDADGDSVTGGLTILVNDDTPEGSNNPVAVFDDDALLGGNPGGVGDVSPDTAFTSGRLDYKFGADGGFIAWLTSGAPSGFTYESSGTDLLIKQGSATVMTLSVNPLNGDYSVVQNASIIHATGMNENSQNFTVSYQVTDNDGDFEVGPLYIIVNDDTPTIVRNNVVQLDDDLMVGGNPGGLGDASPDTVNTMGTLGHLFGADGAGSISWMTSGAPAGFTYEASGVDLLVKQGATTVLTLSVDTLSGDYSVVQNAALIHPAGLDENNQALIISYSVMDADGDAASGQLVVVVNDDSPTVTRNEVVMFDDDALFGGNPNGTGDMNPDIEFANGIVNFSAGADDVGSVEWLNTGAPVGFTYLVEDEVLQVLQGSVNVMTLTLDGITGEYSVVQNAPIQHETDLNENNFALIVGYKVLDSDNDSAIGELVIVVNDDTPVVLSVSDLVFANIDNPTPGGTSTFSYSIGADSRTSFSASNSDFQMDSLTGQIGLNSITNTSITWMSESTTQAEFMLEFDYLPSEYSTDTQHATGTLSFNKVDGTYTVSLSEPIQSFSILTTSEALSYTGYQPESSSTDSTQPAVAVAALGNDVYAQFTGASEPGGGTGTNNLQAVGVDGNGNTFTNGELITQASTWVTTSNSANGVAGDTIQQGEVLDFDLFSYNPFGFTNTEPTAFANELFLKFDGIGTEDLVVILKLIDTNTSADTTKAIVIENSDILKVGNTITPTYGITLDNNDGAVIIQENDFNADGENYLISGAQILVSTEGLIGPGINFVSSIGELGASTGTQNFGATTTDNDVIKISDIGLVTTESDTLDLSLEISLAVKDTDADISDTQQLGIVVSSAPMTITSLENNLMAVSKTLVSTEELNTTGAELEIVTNELATSPESQKTTDPTPETDILSIEDIGLITHESAILDTALEEALPSNDIKADVSDVPQTDVVVTSSSETLLDLAAHSGSMGLVEHLT